MQTVKVAKRRASQDPDHTSIRAGMYVRAYLPKEYDTFGTRNRCTTTHGAVVAPKSD